MKDYAPLPALGFLLGGASTVIILWGIREASGMLGIVLMGIVLAYCGPVGAVLSVPLTMITKKILAERPGQDESAVV